MSRLLKLPADTLVELVVGASETRNILEKPGAGAAKEALKVTLEKSCTTSHKRHAISPGRWGGGGGCR